MKRRAFLTATTLSTIGLTTLLVTSCNTTSKKDIEKENSIDKDAETFELDEETISSLREKLDSGKYSSGQLVQLYLNRIATIDKKGPNLNAIIEVNREAIAIAKAMDKEIKEEK